MAPAPADLDDRRVEITGPAEPKMMINALNSGARVFMADLEDALSPTWANVVGGQAALVDAVRARRSTFDSPEGKAYRLDDATGARSLVRPRGWHLVESARRWSTACRSRRRLFDFGLYLFHNAARALAARERAVLLPAKLESHHEARLWNEVFIHAQDGARHPARLDPGDRPDRDDPRRVRDGRDPVRAARARRRPQRRPLGLPVQRHQEVPDVAAIWPSPDRAQLTMTVPFMRAYTELLVRTCHRRGAHAIGGMAAFIPNRRDPAVTEVALAKVRDDKEREVGDGFDGTWVAHPGPRAGRDGGLRRRPRRPAEPEGRGSARTSTVDAGRAARPARRPAARSPRPASGRTSGSRWPTSTRGCAASARPRSTT